MKSVSMPNYPDEFENRLVQLQGNMYSFAFSLTADRETAEDLTQDTSLKVLVNKDKFQENTNFKGWVFTVMRNLFINHYNRISRTRNIIDTNVDVTEDSAMHDIMSGTHPDREMTLREINAAIDGLSDEVKKSFSMFVSGYKYKEIAETLDLPIGTVKSRIFVARKQLQSSLKDFRYEA